MVRIFSSESTIDPGETRECLVMKADSSAKSGAIARGAVRPADVAVDAELSVTGTERLLEEGQLVPVKVEGPAGTQFWWISFFRPIRSSALSDLSNSRGMTA